MLGGDVWALRQILERVLLASLYTLPMSPRQLPQIQLQRGGRNAWSRARQNAIRLTMSAMNNIQESGERESISIWMPKHDRGS